MTSSNYKVLIAFITLALIGTIAVQAILFSNAVEVRRARFQSELAEALRNAGEQLEAMDAMSVLNSDSAFKPWLQSQIPQIFEEDSMTSSYVQLDQNEIAMMDSIGFYTFRYSADTTYYAPGGPFRVEVTQEGSGTRDRSGRSRLFASQLQRMEEKVLKLDTVLQTFVRSSVRNWVPIEERFSTDEVDSVIEAELLHKSLEVDFEFAISEDRFLTVLTSDNFNEDDPVVKVPIFRKDLWGTSRYLMIQVADTDAYVYRSMLFMICLSLFFTIGVIITFWTTVKQMLKQKKISSIKTDFINNMTHEFKTPLATINLAVDALNSPKLKDNPEKRQHYTAIIKKENVRMHQQVEHVLQMSLLDKDEIQLKKTDVLLSDLLIDAVDHMELTIDERGGNIDMNQSNTEGLYVKVDRHHMSNVLINILDNANKYSPDSPQISIRTTQQSGKLVVSISDRGIGMSKEVKEHVFDRFYRAETGNVHTVKGHGLGLAYAKEIVVMHGGALEVQSQEGKGSTFVLTLERSNQA